MKGWGSLQHFPHHCTCLFSTSIPCSCTTSLPQDNPAPSLHSRCVLPNTARTKPKTELRQKPPLTITWMLCCAKCETTSYTMQNCDKTFELQKFRSDHRRTFRLHLNGHDNHFSIHSFESLRLGHEERMTTITQGCSIPLETRYDIFDCSGSICGSIYEWLKSKECASIDNVAADWC